MFNEIPPTGQKDEQRNTAAAELMAVSHTLQDLKEHIDPTDLTEFNKLLEKIQDQLRVSPFKKISQ